MKLKRTVTVSFLSLALLATSFQAYLFHTTIRSSFLELERSEISADVRRVKNGVTNLLQNLDRLVCDWATWDSTYEFIGNKNETYIQQNLLDETFITLELNAIILWNDEGEVVFGQAVDNKGKDTPQLLQTIVNLMSKPKLSAISGNDGRMEGITLVGQTPMLFVCRPVLHSNGQGPSNGKMLMARLLTSEWIAAFSRQLELPITFHTNPNSDKFSNVWTTLENEQETFVTTDADSAHGFALFDDVTGGPGLLVQISEPRRIMVEGGRAILYTNVFLVLVIMAYSLLALWLLRSRVLSPLERLAAQVQRIGDGTRNMDSVVVVEGKDEISQLGHSVNLMLGKTREATSELATTNMKLLALVNALPAAIWLKSPDGVFMESNPAHAKLLGTNQKSIIGKTDYDFFSLEMADSFRENDRKVMATNQSLVNEEWLTTLHCIETIKTPMHDAQGRLIGVLGVAHDITTRKQAETQREELEHMFRHDLRSPLSSIYKIAELMRQEGGFDPDQEELLQAIEYAGYKMLGLVGASLALQKMEAGTYELSKETFDLLRELKRIITLFELSRGCKDEIIVRVGGRPAQPEDAIVVGGDPVLCFSMLNNLVDNAMEAAPAGTPINIDLERGDREVSIAIHNQGAVPEGIRSRFFEKFITSGKLKGTGLGTYSAKLIAEAHGGGITMHTSDEEGTTVTVRWPGLADDEAR